MTFADSIIEEPSPPSNRTAVGSVLHPETAPPAPELDKDALIAQLLAERDAARNRAERAEQAAWVAKTKRDTAHRKEEPDSIDPESDTEAAIGATIEQALAWILDPHHRLDWIDVGGGSPKEKGQEWSIASRMAGRMGRLAAEKFPGLMAVPGFDDFCRQTAEAETARVDDRMASCHRQIARFRNRLLWLRLVEKHGLEGARTIKKGMKLYRAGAGRPVVGAMYWLGLRRPSGVADETIDTVGVPVGEPEASMGLVVSSDGEVA